MIKKQIILGIVIFLLVVNVVLADDCDDASPCTPVGSHLSGLYQDAEGDYYVGTPDDDGTITYAPTTTTHTYTFPSGGHMYTFKPLGDKTVAQVGDIDSFWTDGSSYYQGDSIDPLKKENDGYGDYYAYYDFSGLGDPSSEEDKKDYMKSHNPDIAYLNYGYIDDEDNVQHQMVELLDVLDDSQDAPIGIPFGDKNPINYGHFSDANGRERYVMIKEGCTFEYKKLGGDDESAVQGDGGGVWVTADNQFKINAEGKRKFIGFDLATFLDTGATDLINNLFGDMGTNNFKWGIMENRWAQRFSNINQWTVENYCKRAMDQNSPVSGVIGPNGDFVLSINAESVETFWVNDTDYNHNISSELYKIEFEIFPSEEIFKPGYLTFNIRVCEGTNCDTIDLTPLNDSNGIDLVIEVGRSEPYSKKGYNMILRTSEDEPFFSNQDKEYDRVCFEFKGDSEKDIIRNTYYMDGSRSSFLDDNLRYCNTLVSTEDLSGDTAGHGPGDWIPSWADGGSGSSSGGSGGSEGEENLP